MAAPNLEIVVASPSPRPERLFTRSRSMAERALMETLLM